MSDWKFKEKLKNDKTHSGNKVSLFHSRLVFFKTPETRIYFSIEET